MVDFAPPKLSKIHILIADGDMYMSGMLSHMLHTIGFTRVTRVGNGNRALELIESGDIDILVTEWNMDGMDGIDLVHYLRDTKRSPDIMLPIVMITGRAERENVEYARDRGVTEFVVKPFSSAMLFDRIRRIFDQPRNFVLASSYVGPDRRHQTHINPADDKRVNRPMTVSNIKIGIDSDRPVLVSHNFGLKKKAGITGSLDSIITPDLLAKAQDVIASYSDQSTQWIATDMKNLERSIGRLIGDLPGAMQQVQQSALSIKSRAGMFGYDMASNVAFSLYVFLYHDFELKNVTHIVILKKHLEVMKVLLAGRALGHTAEMEQELTSELLRMTAKLKTMRKAPDALKDFVDQNLPSLTNLPN